VPGDELVLGGASPRGVLPRGLGRSYGDAALNAGGVVLDMTAWSGITAFDPDSGLLAARAGTSLHAIIEAVLPHGWFLPVTPGTRYVTLGGAVACDVHGKNHHVDGSFSQHVESFTLRTPDGAERQVTRDRDEDVFWATAGGMGLTGVVTDVTLRLLPVETAWIRQDTERCADLDDVMARMTERDHLYRYSVAWIDVMAPRRVMGRSVLTRGEHARLDDLAVRQRRHPLGVPGGPRLRVPPVVPSGVLRRTTIRAFNELWFRKAPRFEEGKLIRLAPFFHPLDAVADWNRLYGPRGFLQYQCVVPFGAEPTLRRIVGRLTDVRCPSFLAVLKRFGAQPGYLTFPIPGWTLALDIPLGLPGLAELLDELDQLVLEAGGRLYLAKDSRMKPETFRHMYPGFPAWREIRDRLDPERVMQSDLARRLHLLD
jgi:decaprenylphospho-beta-D-ribofuranose 2-oxidase